MGKSNKHFRQLREYRNTLVPETPGPRENKPRDAVEYIHSIQAEKLTAQKAHLQSLINPKVGRAELKTRRVRGGKIHQKVVFATDAADDVPSAKGFAIDVPDRMMQFFHNSAFLGYQTLAFLGTQVWIQRACSIPPKDAMAPGYELVSGDKDNDRIDDEKLRKLKRDAERKFKISDVCVKAATNKRLYGYSLVVFNVEGADMSLPFNIDGVRKGSFKGVKVVDPIWVMPYLDDEAMTNQASPHFYEPTWYKIMGGGMIHRSWVVRRIHAEVNESLQPQFLYQGMSLSQQIYERVYAAERVANEAPLLALTKRMMVIDADIINYVADPSEGNKTLAALTYARDNFGVFIKNRGAEVNQLDTSLQDFDALILTQFQLVAAMAGIPVEKYLKTQLKGFTASGTFQIKDYNSELIRYQNEDYYDILIRFYELFTKSEYGEVWDIEPVFNPIDTPTELEQAEINERKTLTDGHLVAMGAIDGVEVRTRLRNDKRSGYTTLSKEPPLQEENDFGSGNGGNGESYINGSKDPIGRLNQTPQTSNAAK